MCLYIDKKRHTKSGFKYVPHTAPKNLVVRKCAKKYGFRYESPYQNTEILFGKLFKTTMGVSGALVERGFHSFTSNIQSKNDIRRSRTTLHSPDVEIIYGVIPAGAKFYMGLDNEVVSDQIIYFKTEADLLKHYKSDKLAKPYSPNA